VQLELLTALLS